MMRSSGNRVLVLFLLLSLLLAGCKTRKMATGAGIADMEMMELVTASPSVVSPRACLSGNVRLSVSVDGNPFSAKGTIRIKEGNGVQIGMTALGLVEVACLEFLPDNMRLIYKIGKEYTEIPYSDVDFLQSSGVSYSLLESVLLNKLFSPEGKPLVQAVGEMTYADEGECVTATTSPINGIVYRFYVEKSTGELVRSEGEHHDGGKVVCRYSDFADVDGNSFPHTIQLTLEGVESSVVLLFELARLNTGDFEFTPRRVSSYGKLDAEQMLKSLGNM